MTQLDQIRQMLDRVIEEASADLDAQAAARAAALDHREAAMAKAIEKATTSAAVDARVRAAWHESARHQRLWFQQLLRLEAATARPCSAHRSSLLRLCRLVEEAT